jgi:hypothetical protein
MKSDFYTKFILTLIAVGLFLNVAAYLTTEVYAYDSGTDVRITNYQTTLRSGETLYVYCTNC